MSTPTTKTDHRAIAGALALADLAKHLDPASRVELNIHAFGDLEAHLHDPAVFDDAAQLAARLGLDAYTTVTGANHLHHRWNGVFAGRKTKLVWLGPAPAPACACGCEHTP